MSNAKMWQVRQQINAAVTVVVETSHTEELNYCWVIIAVCCCVFLRSWLHICALNLNMETFKHQMCELL